jgi:hypothetical protein
MLLLKAGEMEDQRFWFDATCRIHSAETGFAKTASEDRIDVALVQTNCFMLSCTGSGRAGSGMIAKLPRNASSIP